VLKSRKPLLRLFEQLSRAVDQLKISIFFQSALYWLLWARWQEDKHRPSGAAPWVAGHSEKFMEDRHTEQAMGVSASEILVELVSLALQHSPVKAKRSNIARVFRGDFSDFLERASGGFLALSKLSDLQLVSAFLTELVGDLSGSTYMWERQEKKRHYPEELDDKLRSLTIDVFIRGMQSQEAPMESSITLERQRFSALTIMSRDPTMKSSDTGSTLSSLRKHTKKYARRSNVSMTTNEMRWSQSTGFFGDWSSTKTSDALLGDALLGTVGGLGRP
jgi:hypothetical protein